MPQANHALSDRQLEQGPNGEHPYDFPIRFVSYAEVAAKFNGKRVAIVGSGPSVLDNEIGFIDSHDVVVRVNNFKLDEYTGLRTDVHYSFYGVSIRKTPQELLETGVVLCMNKYPNENFIKSQWHIDRGKSHGIDFKSIYARRKRWWFCNTYIPHKERLFSYMNALQGHMPTTGFACILDILAFDCEVYLTGFDFFQSGIHNVNERWREGHRRDPLGHRPLLECKWLHDNHHDFPLTFDDELSKCISIKKNSIQTI